MPGDTQSSAAASNHVSPAALQLANPQLSEQNYELPGEVIQIPAACSTESNVHLVVPGDTIWDLAKDYGVGIDCLVNENSQIVNPATLNPGDCIQIPSGCSSSSSGTLSASTIQASSQSGSLSTSAESTPASSASASSATACPFTINSAGGVSGVVGQLSDGQIRVNGSYPATTFSINNGQITDSSGRGCILTRECKPSIQTCNSLTDRY